MGHYAENKTKSLRIFHNAPQSSTEEGDDDTSHIQPSCPKSDEIRRALEVLREYMLFSGNGEYIQRCVNQISTSSSQS